MGRVKNVGVSKEKPSESGGWRGGDWGEGGGRRASDTFFTDPLPPNFVSDLGNWISPAKMSICQFSEIVLGFLSQVVRATPVCEQVAIVMSEKSFFQS